MKKIKIFSALIAVIMIFSLSANAAPRIPVYKIGNTMYFFDKGSGLVTGFAGEPRDLVFPTTIGGYKVVAIGEGAFRGSTTLNTLVIPEGIYTISDNAFAACPNLKSVEIASSVSYIGSGAFMGCTSLTSVSFAGQLENIEPNAFYNTPWIAGDGDEFTILGGTTLLSYNGNEKVVTVPSGIKKIAPNAFAYNTTLEEIILPDGLQKIGDNAFVHCYSLKNITIPSSVSHIGAGAFDDTIWLYNQQGDFISVNGILICYRGGEEHIEVQNGITGIGSGAFMGNENLKSVKIPDSVIFIDSMAFSGCSSLVWVNIPCSVEWIDEYAFSGCEKLTVYGRENSYSNQYANNMGIGFSTFVYVKCGGEKIEFNDAAPVIRYERTFIPIRPVMEKLRFTVSWDSATDAVICEKGERRVEIYPSGVISVNGTPLETVAPPIVLNSSRLVSVRVICEAAQADVFWNDEERTVEITPQ